MRGIIWHCSKIEYEDTKKSTRPKGVAKDVELSEGKFDDSVLVFACIEAGDTERELDNAVSRLDGLMKEGFYKTNHIVVSPFAHLSNKLANPLMAQEMCEKLVDKFNKLGYKTDALTFGTHKHLVLEFLGHRGSASYFEFSAGA